MASKKELLRFVENLNAKLRAHPGELIAVFDNYCEKFDLSTVVETGISIGIIPRKKGYVFWRNLQVQPLVDLILKTREYVRYDVEENFTLVKSETGVMVELTVCDVFERYGKTLQNCRYGGEPPPTVQSIDAKPKRLEIIIGNKEVAKIDSRIIIPACRKLRIKPPQKT